MHAFILETLLVSGWKRGGEVYWTLEDARAVGFRLMKRRLARQVRILAAEVQPSPVAELPEAAGQEGGAK